MVAGSPGPELPRKSQRKIEPLIPARSTAIGTHVRNEPPACCWEMCNLSPDVSDYYTDSLGQ